MSPREIMNEQETEEAVLNQEIDRMPEIKSADMDEEVIPREKKKSKNIADSNNDYANTFPDWDLLPPQVEIRRVSHRQIQG